MEIREMEEGDEPAVERFVTRIPERDRTFFKEDVSDPSVIKAWTRPGVAYSLAVEAGEVIGTASVVPLHGWSSHVGEVRVIVDPAHRGNGVGRALARQAVVDVEPLHSVATASADLIRDVSAVFASRARWLLDV